MIEIKGVSKQFKNETAIDYRDVTFETGKSYMLLGASGCGKSTLLNMIAGILSPDAGEIVIDGEVMAFVAFRRTEGEMPYGCLIYATGSVAAFATLGELADFTRLNYPDITLSELLPVGDFFDLMWRVIEKMKQIDPRKLGY